MDSIPYVRLNCVNEEGVYSILNGDVNGFISNSLKKKYIQFIIVFFSNLLFFHCLDLDQSRSIVEDE